MNIVEQLGVEDKNLVWQKFAICPGTDPNWFFEAYEKDVEVAKQVDQLCLSCPVFKQCSEAGADGEFGVWGGIFWNGAGKPDVSKNKHKSEEIWALIRKRLGG